MEQPFSDIEKQEWEFERKYRSILSEVGQKKISANQAHVMLMLDYAKLKNNPNSSSDCVYAGREQDILEALALAEERARLGMDDSATKSLAQLAEEQRKPESRASWMVPVGAFALAFLLSAISGDRSMVPYGGQRTPGEIWREEYRAPDGTIRRREYRVPQEIRHNYETEAPKPPKKDAKKEEPVPRWE